jgi:hypothetical protein
MPEPTFGNYKVESPLGVFYRVVIKPAPCAFFLNLVAVEGK